MPETITRPSPIIVQAIQKEGVPPYRSLWMPVAILTEKDGTVMRTPLGAIRYQWGKIYGPYTDGDGKVHEGQKFEYVGDPVGLENDPHLKVLSDPDGLVEKAVKEKYAKIRADRAEAKRRKALMDGDDEPEAPAAPAVPMLAGVPAGPMPEPSPPKSVRRRPPPSASTT